MIDPKIICVARRGSNPLAGLALTQTNGELVLHAFSFTDESMASAGNKMLEQLGIPPDAHISVKVFVWDVPDSMADEQVIAKFATAVQVNDTQFITRLVNSKGGDA